MNKESIYSEIITSKSGLEIPLLKNGKSLDSRYDPLRESLRLLEEVKSDSHFLIILGIASGIFINTILENRKDLFILAVEKSDADIEFLSQLPLIKKLKENTRVEFSSIDSLQEKITQLYVPSFYGNLQVIEQHSWIMENSDCLDLLKSIINKACGLVSADYSVQCHFGKLWQHNILSNILSIEKNCSQINIPLEKTAVIVAAGPTLDSTISIIKEKRNNFYVIATDTAFSILISYNLIPDAVVSIDGQNISNAHFIHSNKKDYSNTLFLFDLCANSSAVNLIIQNKGKLAFFTSGHPLSEYIKSHFSLGLPSLFAGAGTVTICAVDFALKAGFKNLLVLAADFSYSNGKPYARGTYLDRLYNQNSNKLQSLQKTFMALEYRTPLKAKDNTYTNQILEAYRLSFENYLKDNDLQFAKENNIYKISVKTSLAKADLIKNQGNKSGKEIIEELKNIFSDKVNKNEINSFFDLSQSDICLLPLISWLRNHDNIKRDNFTYFYNKAVKDFFLREEFIK